MKSNPKYRSILLALGLAAMTIVAYWPAIQSGGFIWDDDDYVVNNNTLLDLDGLKDIWVSPRATPQYYPLVHTSYWIEYRFWELDPKGYHVTNVLLHALAAILLWRVLLNLGIPGAWLAGALFALHPVHVESVAWITERKNVLSGVFYLAAALAYLKWADAKAVGTAKRSTYAIALLLFVCALLSKTVTSSLPAALLLVAWWKDGRDKSPRHAEAGTDLSWFTRHIVPLVPFFVIGLAFSFITIWLEKVHVGATGDEWDLSFIERCLIAGRALWFYIAKLLWPSDLIFNYTRWEIDAGVWWQYLFPLSFAALVVALWVARKRIGRGPLVAILFFAGSLFPALGFFDVYPMRYSFVADHFQYLASIGVLILVAVAMDRAFTRTRAWAGASPGDTGASRGLHYLVPACVSALVLVSLGVLSAKQCGIYRDLETLWLDTIEKNPSSFMAFNNLGNLRLHEGRLEEAIPLFEESIRLNPNDVAAINNLGVSMTGLGRFEEARRQYESAIATQPDDPKAYHNSGALLAKQGRIEEAIESYRKAVDLDSDLVATHINLGMALAGLGKTEEAAGHFEAAVAAEPRFAAGYLEFGKMLHTIGRTSEAADQYRKALAVDPDLAAAHNHLGMIAAADQLIPAAAEHFRDAVKAAPDVAEFHLNLAAALSAINELGQAGKHFSTAVSLAPESGSVRFKHANFLVQQGDHPAARREYLSAAELMPDVPEPLFQAGVMDLQLGDLAAADARFRGVLELAPDHAPAYNHLAVLLASQGRNGEAVGLLQRAVTLEPENAEFHNNLGVILVRAGNHREALEALEEAVRLQPDYAEAGKNLEDLKRLMNTPSQP